MGLRVATGERACMIMRCVVFDQGTCSSYDEGDNKKGRAVVQQNWQNHIRHHTSLIYCKKRSCWRQALRFFLTASGTLLSDKGLFMISFPLYLIQQVTTRMRM